MKPQIVHGTHNGYHQHYRRGEQPCRECLAAKNEYSKQRYTANRQGPRLARPRGQQPECGTTSGYHWHRRHNEKPCPACQGAANSYQRRLRSGTTITMRVPTLLLAELYLSAPPELQVRLEEHFGVDRMDRVVAEFDAQDQQDRQGAA